MRWEKLVLAVIMLLSIYGCSPLEIRRQLVGMSVSDVESAEKKFTVNIDKNTDLVFDDTLAWVKKIKARLDAADKKTLFIIVDGFDKIYAPSIDTTEIGIAIKPLDGGRSEVTVASQSDELAGLVSADLFKTLANK
jgi:hypothetical protein